MGISSFQFSQMLARTEKGRVSVAKASPDDEREGELHDKIEDDCRAKGWASVHSRMDRKTTQAKGVTDFIILAPSTVFFIECKRPGQKPRPEQLAFAAQCRRHGLPHAFVYSFDEYLAFVSLPHHPCNRKPPASPASNVAPP